MQLFGIYSCPECEVMSAVVGLEAMQDPEVIGDKLCIHSRVASSVLRHWSEIWDENIPVSLSDQMINVCFNKDITCEVKIPTDSKDGFLAAIFHNRKISLLFWFTSRQEFPFCSNCVRRKCLHLKILKNYQVDNQVDEERESY